MLMKKNLIEKSTHKSHEVNIRAGDNQERSLDCLNWDWVHRFIFRNNIVCEIKPGSFKLHRTSRH